MEQRLCNLGGFPVGDDTPGAQNLLKAGGAHKRLFRRTGDEVFTKSFSQRLVRAITGSVYKLG